MALEAERSDSTETFSTGSIALGDIIERHRHGAIVIRGTEVIVLNAFIERHRNGSIDIRGTGAIVLNAFIETEGNDAALLMVDFGTSMKASCVTEPGTGA